MMITLYDFLRMGEAEQYDAVWKGNFLGDRKEGDEWVLCYSMGSFYVEVYYEQASNQVKGLRSFSKVGQLAPYLKPSILQKNRLNNLHGDFTLVYDLATHLNDEK